MPQSDFWCLAPPHQGKPVLCNTLPTRLPPHCFCFDARRGRPAPHDRALNQSACSHSPKNQNNTLTRNTRKNTDKRLSQCVWIQLRGKNRKQQEEEGKKKGKHSLTVDPEEALSTHIGAVKYFIAGTVFPPNGGTNEEQLKIKAVRQTTGDESQREVFCRHKNPRVLPDGCLCTSRTRRPVFTGQISTW